MEFNTPKGKRRLSNIKKYLINWEKKSLSNFQTNVKNLLFRFWKHDVVFEEFLVAGTRQRFDFYNLNKRTVIEVQGAQHQKHVEHFHGSILGWVKQIKKDTYKKDFCKLNDISFFEIFPEDEITREFFEKKGIPLL
jgi:hypothetical protein